MGPDEPRYASIGREMARSGDWVTPRLWSTPWFEKPALLYWMTAAAYRLGLQGEMASRLPVAITSVGFLAFFFWRLRGAFGSAAALYGTAILATSAGWLAYSRVAVTDLPMTAAFAAAMLMSFEWLESGDRGRLPWMGALLGLAVLAKGLVPLMLALPLAWMGRRRILDLLHPCTSGPFLLAAAPWYLLCYWHNGATFVREFIWEHHFERMSSDALQHVQPSWFYIPVLAGGLFPWTPLLAGICRRSLYRDRRAGLLLGWLLFGLVFFSASVNKLPGYLLPLLPAAAALMGVDLAERRRAGVWLPVCAALLIIVPALIPVLPKALASGLSRSEWPRFDWRWAAIVLLAPAVWWLESRGRRAASVLVVAAAVTAGVVEVVHRAYPAIDEQATVRAFWRRVEPVKDRTCVEEIRRTWRYGLNYYSEVPLPDCSARPASLHITGDGIAPLTLRRGAL